jgi:hypothetical protein
MGFEIVILFVIMSGVWGVPEYKRGILLPAWGIAHFVNDHFFKNHKVDQKMIGCSLLQKVPMAFWRNIYGVTYELPRPVGELGSVRG